MTRRCGIGPRITEPTSQRARSSGSAGAAPGSGREAVLPLDSVEGAGGGGRRRLAGDLTSCQEQAGVDVGLTTFEARRVGPPTSPSGAATGSAMA
jgi:hypothetical protein